MKLQFSEGSMRIRLQPAEFDALRSGQACSLRLPLAGSAVEVVLRAAAEFAFAGDEGATRIDLPLRSLDVLAARLPCREGLRWDTLLAGRALSVILEVDVRAGRGGPPPVMR